MSIKIDLNDKKILHELDKNARISYSEIAKKIRLSKNSVINRIKVLEKNKIILGYNALINVNNLGYTTYDIYLKFKDSSFEKEQEIISDLIKNKHAWLVAKVEGNINLSLLISTKTPEEFDQIWDKIYQKIKPYVEVTRIAILLEYHHFPRKYLMDKYEKETTIIAKRGNNKIDKTDEQLIKLISSNARISLLELSNKLNMTTKTIAARIKHLEKEKIILGYRVNLNFQEMGYNYYKLMINLNDLGIRKQMYNFIQAHKNVVYFDKFIGGSDFEFDVEIESFDKFTAFLDELKKKFGHLINNYNYLNPTMIYKSNYFSN
ncbi:Lrp/AsnC family transcriptional regulator [Candidatus Woesearchaeota archaeon]|jgi:Lrp/AsnC family transcriptional regulator, leucine-responsive regulatory protein|nr:Lrp/AsnC family transcriptional regulator [Candidatus Woesearchaeota archaeon]MBT6520113.1 Lrp/AsnC family transcriptional regulator [Candidatus Woesearchaeota archaeon]MBT7366718.1 Lrp/AsnC family transcriptional regulator [Candidatus Woesearchaeota archaeon]